MASRCGVGSVIWSNGAVETRIVREGETHLPRAIVKKTTGVPKVTKPRAAKTKPSVETPAPEPSWLIAARAADSKQAKDIKVLDLREATAFTDTLILITGNNAKQNQTITDEIETELKTIGEVPHAVEGYSNAEWILMDYGDCVINIFSEKARAYYDLDRLWRDGKPLSWS